MEIKTKIIIGQALLLVTLAVILVKSQNKAQIEGVKAQTDTLIVYEVKEVLKPLVCEKKIIDTVFIHDTVLVRESHTFQDSVVKVVASGIGVSIDTIQYRIPTKTIYVREKVKCHKVALESEFGYANGLSNPVMLSYDYGKKWYEVGGSVGYDVITKKPYIVGRLGIKIEW